MLLETDVLSAMEVFSKTKVLHKMEVLSKCFPRERMFSVRVFSEVEREVFSKTV